ncbi:unnamed protein product [Prunus armeniaca]|uniref:FAS1 domain-containing protein n=1 Tax=Prunus armeniaca TaxID=36596 RepID=A0A6J5U6A9_PRUAR|nr:unnamed protein product [Prunus armeniaca]
MSRSRILRNPIAFVWRVVLVCCFLIVTISMLRLPEIPLGLQYPTTKTSKQTSEDENLSIGKFGKMMLEMLPEDLAFTVFVPSEEAFERDLRLSPNKSLVGEKMNDDTYAITSRVLGFSAVPRRLASVNVPIDKELSYDSISGFVLYISKEEDGALTVNRVRSKRVDLRKKGSVVHIMDGAIMDAEFQQSVQHEEQD